jgi:hypothetical protein
MSYRAQELLAQLRAAEADRDKWEEWHGIVMAARDELQGELEAAAKAWFDWDQTTLDHILGPYRKDEA